MRVVVVAIAVIVYVAIVIIVIIIISTTFRPFIVPHPSETVSQSRQMLVRIHAAEEDVDAALEMRKQTLFRRVKAEDVGIVRDQIPAIEMMAQMSSSPTAEEETG